MGNCNSNPNAGCSDVKVIEELSDFNTTIELKLGDIIIHINAVIEGYRKCCTDINENLDKIKDEIEEMIKDAQECCEEMLENLECIIDGLEEVVNPTHETTEEPIVPPTTEEPIEEPTTEEPVTEEPTTEEPEEEPNVGQFQRSNEGATICCFDDDLVTLYYVGIFGIGTVLFTNAGMTTKFLGYPHVRKSDEYNVYNVKATEPTGGTVLSLAKECEQV